MDSTLMLTDAQRALCEKVFADLSALKGQMVEVFGREVPWKNCGYNFVKDTAGRVVRCDTGYRVCVSRMEVEARMRDTRVCEAEPANEPMAQAV